MTISAVLSLLLVMASPTRAEVATRVARDCPEVTRQALSGEYELEDVASVDHPAVEVWISGEYVEEMRIVLWREGSTTKAALAQAPGGVCQQLRRLYAADSSLSRDDAIDKINVDRSLLSSRQKPGLSDSLQQLAEIRLKARLGSTIFAPSRHVRLRITNRLESVTVTFNQPEPSVSRAASSGTEPTSQPDAAAWVEDLVSLLKVKTKR